MSVSEAAVELLSTMMLRRAGHALSRERQYRIESALAPVMRAHRITGRSEEHTSELQSLMRNSYAVYCLKKKKRTITLRTDSDKTTPYHCASRHPTYTTLLIQDN